MSEEMNEGFTEAEALQAIEEKLEESEFYQEAASDVPEETHGDYSDDPGEEYTQPEAPPLAASYSELNAAYTQLQHDAQMLASAMPQIERLRNTNPAEYAIAMKDIMAAQQDLVHREQRILDAHQRVVHETLTKEKQKLLKAIPEWKNPEVAEREKTELRDFLRKRGYSDAEIRQVTARDILTARDAMLKERDGKRKTIPFTKKPARSNAIPGLDPVKQKLMERNVKHGTGDDIELRLMRSGYV